MLLPCSKRFVLLITLVILCCPLSSGSFSILAHEAIIDASWEKYIKPLLKLKYPNATEAELKKAHAFAYGGSIIPDIGYYPMGSPEFSSLVHYMRSGDFITALLEESKNSNEYAFSLGVLCHYEADNFGHSLGTNRSVSILFSRLRKKYGNEVTFEQGRDQHARVEFGFDVLQTARGNYESNAYHDFIGFEVSEPVLERAFVRTYGIKLKDIFESLPAAISVLRFSVKVIIPELTKDAWKIKNSFITKANPLATEKNYRYAMSKNNYRKEFTSPKVKSVLISIVIGVLPKYGSFSRFKPKIPTPECEKLFEQSFDAALAHYVATVSKLSNNIVASTNIDLDTGKETEIGEYKLADIAYYKLLMKLKRNKFAHTSLGLKKNINIYYGKQNLPGNKSHSHKEKMLTEALAQLNTSSPIKQSSD